MNKPVSVVAALAIICSVSIVRGQTSASSPSAGDTVSRPNVYHVNFSHAPIGKAKALRTHSGKQPLAPLCRGMF